MNLKPYSATVLLLTGLIMAVMGLYFIFFRPPLLPEDVSYMGTTMPYVNKYIPTLLTWLQKVFWVLGGYIFTSGLLISYISFTSFRQRTNGVLGIITLAGISSIGSMAAINFLIDSNFKWLLLSFSMLWAIAIILYLFHK